MCTCLPGFGKQYNPAEGVYECLDKNECLSVPNTCIYGQCVNTFGGYECLCIEGFRWEPGLTQCEDVDECETNTTNCSNNEQCKNSIGSYHCLCVTGFARHGDDQDPCLDIDECLSGELDCLQNRSNSCFNTFGSYVCGEFVDDFICPH